MDMLVKRPTVSLVVLLILALRIVPTASAHTPIQPGSNESLATATLVPDPTKSWAIYANLREGGEAQYYTFDIIRGQRIHLTLFTTTSAEDAHFTPGVLLMGPGVPNQGFVPNYVEVPPGAGVMAVSGTRAPQATYEAFSPSSFVHLADISLDAPADGTYYVAVQSADRGGHYGVAIGDRESFTISEWLLIPFSVLSVYAWERQSLPVVLGPALAVVCLGLVLLIRRHRKGRRLDVIGWMAALAGLLFLGTGATVVSQMILSISRSPVDAFVIFTLILAVLPTILGLLAVRLAVRKSGHWTLWSRLCLVLLGGGALATWAGLLIGPVLAIAAAVLPSEAARACTPEVEA